MDRIEDETIRYLFFLQRVEDPGASVPYPEVWAEEPDDEGGEPVAVAADPLRTASASPRRKKPRKIRSSISRATSNAKRKKSWPRYNSLAAKRLETQAAGDSGEKGRPKRSLSVREREKI